MTKDAEPRRGLLAETKDAVTVRAIALLVRAAEAHSGRRIVVVDIRPPAPGDHNGLSALYLVIGWIVGGYLVAAILGISAGSRPETLNRATIRFGARALRDRHRPGRALIVGPWGHG